MADLDLNTYLAELEAQRASLDIQINGVRARLGLSPSDTTTVNLPGVQANASVGVIKPVITGKVRSDEFYRMSIPEAVETYLEIMKQPQSPTAIVNALKAGGILSQSKNFYTTVWTAMKRLRSAGRIVNTPGGWGLSDWYPNKPKAEVEEKKPSKGKGKKPKPQRGKKSAKIPRKPRKPAEGAQQTGGWRAFLAAQLKAGKTMQEASEIWKTQKAGV
jgi:hypothetical protein